MSKEPGQSSGEDFDEEELIRSEFESIVSGLSLDESAPTTYLDELDRHDHFIAPNPPSQTPRSFFNSAKRAVVRWFKRDYRDDDGVEV